MKQLFNLLIFLAICVVVPLKNSQYRYATTFEKYVQASDYVEERFYEYIENYTDQREK